MYDAEIQAASRQYDVPVSWIQAVIQTESAWKPDAYRAEPRISDASYGLMQLLYKTAQGLGYQGAASGLYDPATNIDLGSKLLGQLRQRYGDDFRRVYSAYNSGNPDLWQRSTQVASNVARAVENLSQWVTTGVSEFAQTPESGPVVALLALVILYFWTGKRR